MKNYFYSIFALLINSSNVAQIIDIANMQEYQAHIIQKNKQAILQFSAGWCGACQSIKGSFEDIATDPEFSTICFARVDIDSCKELAALYSIMGIQSFVFLEDGIIKDQKVGIENPNYFKESLKNNLRTTFRK